MSQASHNRLNRLPYRLANAGSAPQEIRDLFEALCTERVALDKLIEKSEPGPFQGGVLTGRAEIADLDAQKLAIFVRKSRHLDRPPEKQALKRLLRRPLQTISPSTCQL
jgi:hypothetical protein